MELAYAQVAEADRQHHSAPVVGLRCHRENMRGGGTLAERTDWLESAWLGKPVAFFVSMTATGHNFIHFGEAWCIRSLIAPGSSR